MSTNLNTGSVSTAHFTQALSHSPHQLPRSLNAPLDDATPRDWLAPASRSETYPRCSELPGKCRNVADRAVRRSLLLRVVAVREQKPEPRKARSSTRLVVRGSSSVIDRLAVCPPQPGPKQRRGFGGTRVEASTPAAPAVEATAASWLRKSRRSAQAGGRSSARGDEQGSQAISAGALFSTRGRSAVVQIV
jgi:hypothetical protein